MINDRLINVISHLHAFAHAKVSKLIFYFISLVLTGHIGIIFDHFKFSTDSFKRFLSIFIPVEFRKNLGTEPIQDSENSRPK